MAGHRRDRRPQLPLRELVLKAMIHGTESGYTSGKCRCSDCVRAGRAAARRRMRKLRAPEGLTLHDKARAYATRRTLEAHRGTFSFFQMEFLNRHRETA